MSDTIAFPSKYLSHKPLVVKPWPIDLLEVKQMRTHGEIKALRITTANMENFGYPNDQVLSYPENDILLSEQPKSYILMKNKKPAKNRIDKILKHLDELDSDVIAMQEILTEETAKVFTNYNSHYAEGNDERKISTMFLTKKDLPYIYQLESHKLASSERFPKLYKRGLNTLLEKNSNTNQVLRVYINLHLKSHLGVNPECQREDQMKYLSRIIKYYQSLYHHSDIYILGDFNENLIKTKRSKHFLKLLKEVELEEAFDIKNEHDPYKRMTSLIQESQYQIDGVLLLSRNRDKLLNIFTSHWKVRKGRRVPPRNNKEEVSNPSDHGMVVVDVSN